MNEEYTRRQRRLLHQMEKSDTWFGRYHFFYILYLLPVFFVASSLWSWFRISQRFDYCWAIRLNGEIRPIEVDANAGVVRLILLMGFLLLVLAWSVTSELQQRQTFKEIWKIRQRGNLQQGADREKAE
jgi:hypothetical protein